MASQWGVSFFMGITQASPDGLAPGLSACRGFPWPVHPPPWVTGQTNIFFGHGLARKSSARASAGPRMGGNRVRLPRWPIRSGYGVVTFDATGEAPIRDHRQARGARVRITVRDRPGYFLDGNRAGPRQERSRPSDPRRAGDHDAAGKLSGGTATRPRSKRWAAVFAWAGYRGRMRRFCDCRQLRGGRFRKRQGLQDQRARKRSPIVWAGSIARGFLGTCGFLLEDPEYGHLPASPGCGSIAFPIVDRGIVRVKATIFGDLQCFLCATQSLGFVFFMADSTVKPRNTARSGEFWEEVRHDPFQRTPRLR